jgi:prophage regulatory protein
MRLHRAYASDITGPTTRMNRIAHLSHDAAEPPRLFARLPTVMQATGLGRSTIYRLVASGAFPQPVHLGPRAIAWRRSDLERWSATGATNHH